MYFSGHLKIDPASRTDLVAEPPSSAFLKFLNVLVAGQLSTKEEHETFTAITILQQIHVALKRLGIDNIVRLTKDDIDFYYDSEGKKEDLKEAIEQFELGIDAMESGVFQSLELVLEHEDEDFSYLMEIRVARIHPVGECPIQFHLNGLIKDYALVEGDEAKLLTKMKEEAFSDQESLDQYLAKKERRFETYLSAIDMEIKKAIRCDAITMELKRKMVRPHRGQSVTQGLTSRRGSPEPIYHGYPGFASTFFYAWMWSELCFSHNMFCRDLTLVDGDGHGLAEIGSVGFSAGDGPALDPKQDFMLPEGALPLGVFGTEEMGDSGSL